MKQADPRPGGRRPGIGELRRDRGRERVSFDEVADHMCDYLQVHPRSELELDRFAAFLASIEHVPHAHSPQRRGSTRAPGR